jgi:dolichol-phosphate mannosyltransferase
MGDRCCALSLVFPFYNEQGTLPAFIQDLSAYIRRQQWDIEIILVDDGSTDSSVDIIKSQHSLLPRTTLVRLLKNAGSHAALYAGILHARGRHILTMSVDLQDTFELIGKLYRACLDGHALALATRKHLVGSYFDTLFSRLYAMVMIAFVSPYFPRHGFDIVMFDADIQHELNKQHEYHPSIFLHILSLCPRPSVVEFEKKPRLTGTSKWTLRRKIALFINSITGIKTNKPPFIIREVIAFNAYRELQ